MCARRYMVLAGHYLAAQAVHLKVADEIVGDYFLAPLQRLYGVGKALHVGPGHKRFGQARINPRISDLAIDDGY